jgi:hypothetical protein
MALKRFARTILFAAMLLLPLWLAGCGGSPAATSDQMLRGLISAVHGAAFQTGSFQALFVAGEAPKDAERARYTKYTFEIKSSSVSGDAATITVVVRDLKDNKELGETEWTAAKVGNEWKLKSAPLPSGVK